MSNFTFISRTMLFISGWEVKKKKPYSLRNFPNSTLVRIYFLRWLSSIASAVWLEYMVAVCSKKRCLKARWYFLKIASIASKSRCSSSSRGIISVYLGYCINLYKKPSSLSWAYPICPRSKLVIYSYFFTFNFFFYSINCFFIYNACLPYSSCFRFSTILWNSFIRFSGPLSLLLKLNWEVTLLLWIMDYSILFTTFCLYSSECSTCSSLVISKRRFSKSSSCLLPILWLFSLM